MQSLPPEKPLRILEVGAGYGSTTMHLLPHLPPQQTTYVFTDISNFFLQKAANKFSDYPFVSYHILDLDHNPIAQGYIEHSFDVIIAASVLHDTRNLQQSIKYLHSLLAPGGLLIAIEETKFHRSFDLGMGLQQGFDNFEDEQLRPQHPLLSRDGWIHLLSNLGFDSSVVLNYPGNIPDFIGFDVLLAIAAQSIRRFQPEQLRSYLKQKLPDYMVPSSYLLLDTLPLTANGKIDRKALPTPTLARLQSQTSVAAPRTEIEQQLAEIWAKALQLPQIGIDDNFFEVGGDSLLATQLISQVRETFATELPLQKLFELPTVAGLAEYIETNTRENNTVSELPIISPIPEQRYQPFPLTDTQQAYWLGRDTAFELSNIATHVYFEIDSDNLDIERSNRGWQRLISHHEMLRMVLLSDGQQQILQQVPDYEIPIADLRGEDCAATTAYLQSIREQMSHQMLPADKWPLFEIRATRFEQNKVRLHVSFDVLVADGWSLLLLFQQWNQLYQNPETQLPPLEVSFRDYVLAEKRVRETQLYQRAQKYWCNRLDTLPAAPQLPLAKNPSTIKTPQFIRYSGELDQQQWQSLKQRAQRMGLTPTGVLLAAFAEVLAAWSKSQKFTINLTLFNRLPLHPQVNEIVGDFTSLTLLEVDNSTSETFGKRALRLQQRLWQDLDHRYVSGVEVLRELARRKGGTYRAMMPVIFTSALGYGSLAGNSNELNQLGEIVYGISQTPQVWLDHQASEQEERLVFNWDVVAELFPEGMIDDMFATYCQLLTELATQESVWQQSQRQLVPAYQLEQRAIVNQTAAPNSGELLHTLFIKQVELRKHSPAVISPERVLTYQELYQLANRIGHRLQQLGAKPNTLVAVVMSKGWQQVVAVLAVLMSGAAYLPIDPNLPRERRSHLLAVGEVKLALTEKELEQTLTWPEQIQRLCIDDGEWEKLPTMPIVNLQSAEDLAYVIFTSGSTGVPKGVMIDHRGAVNTILDINQRFQVTASDRVLAISALNFDLSVYDIFGILAGGGTIVMPTASRTIDAVHWLELMVTHQVTLWNTVPALMQILVEYLLPRAASAPTSLRLALLSGDWLPVNLPAQLQSLWSNIQVVSLGGATEASIWSIHYPIADIDPAWNSIPYGQPLTNQCFYVLNELLQPCPVWVTGQLYVAGIGLAKGYWGDTQKTEASFITHPQTQERLYKTGDWGRYLPSGNIEFLGREDFQVKINGYRIELGEIEVALKQHPAIKEAVVNVVGTSGHNQQLVAYVIPQANTDTDIFALETADVAASEQLWNSMVASGREQAQQDVWPLPIQTFSGFWQEMECLYVQAVCVALKKLGTYLQPGEKYHLDELISRCQIAPRYRKWLHRALLTLVEQGWLQQQGELFASTSGLPDVDLELTTIKGQVAEKIGLSESEINWIFSSAQNLAEIITEKTHSAQIYASEETTGLYQKIFPHCHAIVESLIKTLVQSLPPEKPLRILEVGAGYGSTTMHLLPHLPPQQTTYVFTDISNFFLQKAANKFSDYPFVSYHILDLDHNPIAQGYIEHSFDVIIAASVLHDTRNLQQSIKYLHSLLAPGGLLIAIEETKFHRSFDLGMGLQQGFDNFEDEQLRPQHPLLSRDGWIHLLSNLGFDSSVVLNYPGNIPDFIGFDVLLAIAAQSIRRFQPEQLRSYLKQKLPDYMVPSSYLLLDTLPLTANGKIDRKALPVTSTDVAEAITPKVAPRNTTEKILVKIWTSVLRREQISIYDNFFDVGGESLLGIQLIGAIQEAFQVDISLQHLYYEPTVAGLAVVIEDLIIDQLLAESAENVGEQLN
ncbi:MAG: amino acid adenylation domain-containing protein [Dolichospermum sp. DEX182a]|nr:amino acid adenylation domain-containing protein [Dolichospermum sp. DEX182a]